MRPSVAAAVVLLAASASAQTVRPLPPEMTGTWEMVEMDDSPDVVVEVLALRLEIAGNRVTQRDSLRLPTGGLEARAFTMDCGLSDVDRAARGSDLEPAVLHDVMGCTLLEVEAGFARDGGYGPVVVEGDVMTMGALGTGYRAVLRRVAE